MPIHLLIAPPAAGKTHFCLERIRTVLRADPLAGVWMLVSDRLQADQARARLGENGAVLAVRVAAFNDLNAEILERAGRGLPLAADAMLHRLLQDVLLSLSGAGQLPYYAPICDRPGFLLEIRQRIGELKRALVTPERLAEAARGRSGPGLAELARIYAAYQARLQQQNWADTEGLAWLAHAALQDDLELMAQTALLVVDGFDSFNPAQLRILRALAGRAAEAWITFPGHPDMLRAAERRFRFGVQGLQTGLDLAVETLPDAPHLPPSLVRLEAGLFEAGVARFAPLADLERIEARSPAEESREALRWLKARILRNGIPLTGCALAVPELETYRPALKAAAAEFGLSLRFLNGPPLANTPPAAALSDLLALLLDDYPLRPLLDSIRSPYFNLQFSRLARPDAKLLEIVSRYGQVVQGFRQWEEVLQLLVSQPAAPESDEGVAEAEAAAPRLPVGPQASRLLDGLRTLAHRLAPPAGQNSLKDWTAWLEDLLDKLGFFDCLLESDETGACHMFEQLLLGMGHSEALTGPYRVDFAGFLQELGGLLAAVPVKDENHADAILALPLIDLRGVRFQAVAVLGLAEGSFPAVERADPFLDEELRLQLGLEPRLDQAQSSLFYQAVTRAECCLLLTRPYLAKDGETWEPSPYWNAVQELLEGAPARIRPEDTRPLSEAASPEELLFWSARRRAQQDDTAAPLRVEAGPFARRWEHIRAAGAVLAARLQKDGAGIFDGGLAQLSAELGTRYGPQAGWSASRLESYATCPYFFLASYTLGLEVLEPPQLGYQANQLGSLLHEILKEAFDQAPDPANTEEVLARLPQVARRVFEAAPGRYQFRPSLLWEVQKEELLQILDQTVRSLADLDPAGGWRPVAFECGFGFADKPPLRIPLESGEVRLHGIVDRVDVNPHGQLRIIDYKSGSSHLAAQDLIDGRRLQLPLYAMAADRALGLGQPVEGFYWKLFQAEASALKLSRFACEAGEGPQAAFQVAVDAVAAIVGGIRRGAFEPSPPQGGCPSYCPAAAWCWHYQPERR